jgi:hypothetical protein
MNRRAMLAAATVAALLGGCTLVVGELDLRCTEQSDCDTLNAKYDLNLSEDCFVYQCRPDQRGCEKRPRDLDEDGYPAPICDGLVEGELDCDDNVDGGAARRPLREEKCDGIDNNCDGRIDEGRGLSVVQEQHEFLPGAITALSATALSDGRGLVVASVELASASAPQTPLNEIWAVIVDPDRQLDPKRVTADGISGTNCGASADGGSGAKCVFSGATAFAGRAGLFTAATETAGCRGAPRVVFGLEPSAVAGDFPAPWSWSQASSTQGPLTVEPEAVACEPAARVMLAGTREAGSEPSALAAWWNPENATIALARLTSDSNTLRVLDMAAVTRALPAASIDREPALVALAGAVPGYLLAYASADIAACAGIALAHVTADSSGPPPLPLQAACVGAAGDTLPVLATSLPREQTPTPERIGLAWLDADGMLVFSGVRVDHDQRTVETSRPLEVAGPVNRQSAPSLAWVPEQLESEAATGGRWLVTWTDDCGAARCLHGALIAADDASSLGKPFALVDLGQTGATWMVTQVSRGSLAVVRAEATALHVDFLGCP